MLKLYGNDVFGVKINVFVYFFDFNRFACKNYDFDRCSSKNQKTKIKPKKTFQNQNVILHISVIIAENTENNHRGTAEDRRGAPRNRRGAPRNAPKINIFQVFFKMLKIFQIWSKSQN
jgi:hypothetical protein